jgi:hypothetical protein
MRELEVKNVFLTGFIYKYVLQLRQIYPLITIKF